MPDLESIGPETKKLYRGSTFCPFQVVDLFKSSCKGRVDLLFFVLLKNRVQPNILLLNRIRRML